MGYSVFKLANYQSLLSNLVWICPFRQLSFSTKCKRIRLKLFILFYDIPACNKRAEILPLATGDIAYLWSQSNHIFALPISMPRFKSINFSKIG